MSRHHIMGSEVGRVRDLTPGVGSMRTFRDRRYPLSVRLFKAIGQLVGLMFVGVVALHAFGVL